MLHHSQDNHEPHKTVLSTTETKVPLLMSPKQKRLQSEFMLYNRSRLFRNSTPG